MSSRQGPQVYLCDGQCWMEPVVLLYLLNDVLIIVDKEMFKYNISDDMYKKPFNIKCMKWALNFFCFIEP